MPPEFVMACQRRRGVPLAPQTARADLKRLWS